MLEELKKEVYEANMQLPKYGLVTFTWGNVSGIDREKGLFVIKPSGVEYDKLTPEDMVVMDLEGNKVEGKYNPSSDTPTHLELYTGLLIADYFADKDYEAVPAVLCKNHGPFTWGKDAHEAVHNAVVLEEVAKMAARCEMIQPKVAPAPQELQDKHYYRKHGENAYYGQK